MAGSNRFAYYSDVAEQNTRFSTISYNTNWFDEITRLGMYSSSNNQSLELLKNQLLPSSEPL
jgi:hypothetical protein